MPILIDKEKERQRILEAFHHCLREKPFDKITLRDISAKANTPHPTVLTYFKDKHDIILSYVEYIADKSIRFSREWVQNHSVDEFPDSKEYIKTLLLSASKLDKESKLLYTGALNVYILAQYESDVRRKILTEFENWTNVLQEMLENELDFKKDNLKASAFLLTCLEGICLNTYNGVFDDETLEGVIQIVAGLFV